MRQPTEMEMRVARALLGANGVTAEHIGEITLSQARAAIAAMREPSALMVVRGDDNEDYYNDGAEVVWRRMINAASPEQT
jgi:hypothetical protein